MRPRRAEVLARSHSVAAIGWGRVELMWKSLRLRWQASLAARIVAIVLVTQAALLPVLFVGLDRVAWNSNGELFASIAQDYLSQRAGELTSGRIQTSDAALQSFLHGIVASGFVAYGEVRIGDRFIRSHAATPTTRPKDVDADRVEPGDDRIYYRSTAWRHGADSGDLLLGFDESMFHERVGSARRLLLFALLVFVSLVIVAGVLLARYLTRPLDRLRLAADRIAAGNMAQALETRTGIREVDNLSRDLEKMRQALGAMSARIHQKQRLETVGTLAGGVSHEFNNILLPIILFLESALDTLPEDHPARTPVARALMAAGRARDIVAKLLVFSRHGAPATAEPVPIARAVDEALRLFASICPSYITLQGVLDPACEPVLVDSGSIVQVVMNLCSNAYRAIPASGGTIQVNLGNVIVAGRPAVELSVTDTGVGMDGTTLSRIFEPFFTTREIGQGSGLGLAVVHGIVAELHGTISVESRPGDGSVFRIRIPVQDAEGPWPASS